MSGAPNFPDKLTDKQSDQKRDSAATAPTEWWRKVMDQMKTIAIILIALIILILFIKPSLLNLPAIDYVNLHTWISGLNTPLRVKNILFFLLQYNVFLLLCACFGAAVGASEILSRYRDEPFLAISSPPGRRYLAVNAAISLAAFYLLYHFGDSMFSGVTKDPLLMSVVSGFGAMVVMRSKLFSFKTEGGENYAIGPDAVLSTFLASVDRQIDRHRASRRQDLVYYETQDVDNPESAPDFFMSFLVSYQNLSNDEKEEVDGEVKRIYEQSLSPRLKFMTAAFGFLNIMGESNFRALVQQLKRYQQLDLAAKETVANNGSAAAGAEATAASSTTTPRQPESESNAGAEANRDDTLPRGGEPQEGELP
jgi:hypothetical protein